MVLRMSAEVWEILTADSMARSVTLCRILDWVRYHDSTAFFAGRSRNKFSQIAEPGSRGRCLREDWPVVVASDPEPLLARSRQLHGAYQRLSLVEALLVFAFRDRVGHNAGPSLDVSFLPFHQHSADSDARVEISGEVGI